MNDLEIQKQTVPRRGWTYLKAILFSLPSIVFFSLAVIFVLPKIKQMCADTGYDARFLFAPIDMISENWGWLLLGTILAFAVFERWVPIWRKYRVAGLAGVAFLLHSAVLLSLFAALIVCAVVGPALSRHL